MTNKGIPAYTGAFFIPFLKTMQQQVAESMVYSYSAM
jgi:hypothetical protein